MDDIIKLSTHRFLSRNKMALLISLQGIRSNHRMRPTRRNELLGIGEGCESRRCCICLLTIECIRTGKWCGKLDLKIDYSLLYLDVNFERWSWAGFVPRDIRPSITQFPLDPTARRDYSNETVDSWQDISDWSQKCLNSQWLLLIVSKITIVCVVVWIWKQGNAYAWRYVIVLKLIDETALRKIN